MSRSLIVAVGGTGQYVLHYYAQLFQIGSLRSSKFTDDPFHAVVVDSDALMPSLATLDKFWDQVRAAHPDASSVPRIDYFPVAQSLRGKVMEAVVGQALPAYPAPHPAEGIFDSVSLEQGVREGLYARPALSAVLQTDWEQFPVATLAGFERVLVVGSLIGGTGGGLIAPLLSQLAARIRSASAAQAPKLRALFFGEYFKLTGDGPVRDAPTRFPSNKILVAQTLKELAPAELEQFSFVQPKVPMERNVGREKNPINLAWPEQTDPLWQGVSVLEELRIDTATPAAVQFANKERSGLALRDLRSETTRLNASLGLARAIAARSVLKRIPKEPWVTAFYGPTLPRTLAKAYTLAKRNPALDVPSVSSMAGDLQRGYEAQWSKVSTVFPAGEGTRASLSKLRAAGWKEPKMDAAGITSSRDTLVGAVSALVLYEALRGGAE